MVPNIGQKVLRRLDPNWSCLDWVCQKRLGDEQYVLYWGFSKERFDMDDKWEDIILEYSE